MKRIFNRVHLANWCTMLEIMKPILEVVHVVQDICHYVLVLSYVVGKGIYLALGQILSSVVEFIRAVIIVGEEFYNFLNELNASIADAINYVRNSTNIGIVCVIEGFTIVAREMAQFFTNSQMHSKILATKIGRFFVQFSLVLQGALLLLADFSWWLITLLPRTLFSILITIGDMIVFGISATCCLLLSTLNKIIDDIFRYTIAIIVLVILVRHRKIIKLAAMTCVWKTVEWSRQLYGFIFVLQSAPVAQRHSESTDGWRILDLSTDYETGFPIEHFLSYRMNGSSTYLRSSPVGTSLPFEDFSSYRMSRPSTYLRRSPGETGLPIEHFSSSTVRHRMSRPSIYLRSSPGAAQSTAHQCVVCLNRNKSVVLLPCRHLCMCEECCDYILHEGTEQNRFCPLCRCSISRTLHVYI